MFWKDVAFERYTYEMPLGLFIGAHGFLGARELGAFAALVLALFHLVLGGSCLVPKSSTCGEVICGADLECHREERCILKGQAEPCVGRAEGETCVFGSADGLCTEGVCVPAICGDGVVGLREQCDRTDLNGWNCKDVGFYQEEGLACQVEHCRYDVSSCRENCGDGIVNGPELCDGPEIIEECIDVGFDAGDLGCTGACTYDLPRCARFGWPRVAGVPQGGAPYGAAHISSAGVSIFGGGNSMLFVEESDGQYLDYSGGVPGLEIVGIYGEADDFVIATNTSVGTGVLYRVIDGQWELETAPSVGELRELWGSPPNNIFAAGSTGLLLYDGATWSIVESGTRAISGSGPDNIYRVDEFGNVVRFGGNWWSILSLPSVGIYEPQDIAVGADGIAFAAASRRSGTGGVGGALYRIEGQSAELMWEDSECEPRTVEALSESEVYMGGLCFRQTRL